MGPAKIAGPRNMDIRTGLAALALATAFDLATRQRAADATDHGAQRAIAAGVDRPPQQRAGDTADHQTGRAVRLAAAQPPVLSAPFAIGVTLARIRLVRRSDQRGGNHRGSTQREHELTHIRLLRTFIVRNPGA